MFRTIQDDCDYYINTLNKILAENNNRYAQQHIILAKMQIRQLFSTINNVRILTQSAFTAAASVLTYKQIDLTRKIYNEHLDEITVYNDKFNPSPYKITPLELQIFLDEKYDKISS